MKSIRIHYLQHVPFEGLGCIQEWVQEGGHALTVTRMYKDEPLPAMLEFDWLFIMGGPMGVCDDEKFPWLKVEKRFIKEAIKNNKLVLGICLGAQLIADALGAKVTAAQHKEIGRIPFFKTGEGKKAESLAAMPDELTVFHWHGDTFELPNGATLLAESAACKNQVFLYGDRILGLQFHFEATPISVLSMLLHGKNELSVRMPFVQSPKEIQAAEKYYNEANMVIRSILNYFLDKLAHYEPSKKNADYLVIDAVQHWLSQITSYSCTLT